MCSPCTRIWKTTQTTIHRVTNMENPKILLNVSLIDPAVPAIKSTSFPVNPVRKAAGEQYFPLSINYCVTLCIVTVCCIICIYNISK